MDLSRKDITTNLKFKLSVANQSDSGLSQRRWMKWVLDQKKIWGVWELVRFVSSHIFTILKLQKHGKLNRIDLRRRV